MVAFLMFSSLEPPSVWFATVVVVKVVALVLGSEYSSLEGVLGQHYRYDFRS